MKFCPVVPEICRGQVHGPRKERRKRRRIITIILDDEKNNFERGQLDVFQVCFLFVKF
jgi:hypothetical protein